jgi:hypothetical protein
MGKGGERED